MRRFFNVFSIILFAFLIGITSVKASSFSINTNNSNPTVGSQITLTIQVSDITGRFNVSSSNAGVVSANVSSAWVENNSFVVTLNAINVGNAIITVSPETISNGAGKEIENLAGKTISINVKAKPVSKPPVQPANLSSNNFLKSLTIENVAMEPAFNKNTLEYYAKLGVGTELLKINAEVEDATAKVSGIGSIKVSEGINLIKVVVTAQNGATKTYVVKAEVEEANPIDVMIGDNQYRVIKKKELLPKAKEGYTLTSVIIDDVEVPCYKKEGLDYVLVGLKDSLGNIKLYTYINGKYNAYLELTFNTLIIIPGIAPSIPEGYEEGTITINDSVITCYKNKTEFVLIYGTNLLDNNTDFYSYDTKDNTIQRYSKTIKYPAKIKETNEDLIEIIYGLVAICVVLILSTAIQGTINKKKYRKDHPKEEKRNSPKEETVPEEKEIKKEAKSEIKDEKIDDLIQQIDESYTKTKKTRKDKKKDFLDETSVDIYKIDL